MGGYEVERTRSLVGRLVVCTGMQYFVRILRRKVPDKSYFSLLYPLDAEWYVKCTYRVMPSELMYEHAIFSTPFA